MMVDSSIFQHIYYGKYLRILFYNFFVGHSFFISQWDFSIGEGSDILQALNYYVIGDPFAFFSFLFPSHFMYVYYCGMCIVRIYCAGLAFIYLCKVLGHSEKTPILAGAFMYAFCYWAIYNCARHPYFINPLVWFPLVIAGIEKIIQGKQPFLYIFFVMVAAVSGFYFFYMIVILISLYIIIRLSCLYGKDIKKIFKSVFTFFIYSCLSLGLAAFLFLPICYIFLHDTRTTHFQTASFFYPLLYYFDLPKLFLFPRDLQWLCMGFPVLSAASLLLLFKEPKKNCFLLILLACCLTIIMLPICGLALNGFSYISNRWSWAFALLCSYVVVVNWEKLLKAFRIIIILALLFAIYAISLNLKNQCIMMFYIALLVFFAFTTKQKREVRGIIAFCLILLNIGLNANIKYHSYCKECMTQGGLVSVLSNETALIKKAAFSDNDFFRYSGKDLTPNASINQNLSSVRYNWTLSNPYIMEFRKKLEIPPYSRPFNYGDYDSRASLESLACVRYFYKRDQSKEIIPYGFIPAGTKAVYKNSFALPIAYTYDSYMTLDEWDVLDSVKKGEALLQTAVLEMPEDEISHCNLSSSSRNVPFSLIKSDSAFTVLPRYQGSGELYLCLKNLRTAVPKDRRLIIHVKTSNGSDISFFYIEPGQEWYAGVHDVSVNLGFSEKPIEKIDILFPNKEIYTVDDIQVISLPMTQFASLVDEREKDAFNNVKIGTNAVEGDISLTEPKLLCFAIPFAEGWRATVDGKPARLFRTNVMHMSVPLEAGEHKVVLTYHTPLLRVGFIVSLCSWVIFLLWAYRSKRK